MGVPQYPLVPQHLEHPLGALPQGLPPRPKWLGSNLAGTLGK